MFDHISLRVGDLAKSRTFYLAALAPLGIGLVVDLPGSAAFGQAGRARFWLGRDGQNSAGVHVAFAALDRAAVRAFYNAAVGAGGTDNGAPGLRPRYHADYYGAFVLDPDGHNAEAVCRNHED